MRRMIDLGRGGQRGPFHNIIDTPTSLDCAGIVVGPRDVRFRRTFRTLVDCMFPSCCAFSHEYDDTFSTVHSSSSSSSSTVVTVTFFGHRNGRVTFCIQDDTRGSPPLLLLEFSVPTSYLAREMHHDLLRIALDYCPDPRRPPLRRPRVVHVLQRQEGWLRRQAPDEPRPCGGAEAHAVGFCGGWCIAQGGGRRRTHVLESTLRKGNWIGRFRVVSYDKSCGKLCPRAQCFSVEILIINNH
ncbi:hypothetical protein ACP275_03G002300 [Erythranthe tilingii]